MCNHPAGGGDGEAEAEFDDTKASIRTGRGRAARRGGGAVGGKDNVEEEDEDAKKEAQALLDGVCMSLVRVLIIDLHTVLGRCVLCCVLCFFSVFLVFLMFLMLVVALAFAVCVAFARPETGLGY